MNTDVSAWLWCDDDTAARQALREVERDFREAHARFTRFEASSELSALNAWSGRTFAASPELFEVVEMAQHFYHLTGGLFNPSILDALEAAGYDRTFESVKTGGPMGDETASRQRVRVATLRIALDAERRTIALPAGMRIDLGGIAKGWTAQRSARRLARNGSCLVDAGGDIAAVGAPPGESGWRIGVVDPFDERRDLTRLRLRDAAIATSGIGRRRWVRNGLAQHHLIDPRLGRPSHSDLFSVTLIAPTAIEADVYAKTVFLLGTHRGLDFVEERASLAALLVKRDGEMLASSRLGNYDDVHFVYEAFEFSAA